MNTNAQMPPALQAVYNVVTEGMSAYPYLGRKDSLLQGKYPMTVVWDDRYQIMQMIVCIPARFDENAKQRLIDEVATLAQADSIEANGATVNVDMVYWHYDEYYTIHTFSIAAIVVEAV